MKQKSIYILTIVALFSAKQTIAQKEFVQDHSALWLGAKLKYNFSKNKYFSVTDIGYRFINNRNTTLIRSGVGLNINSQLNIISGLAYFHVQPSANEFRIFHYINYSTVQKKIFFNARVRLEERWINENFFFRNGLLAGINLMFPNSTKKNRLSLYDEYLHHIGHQNKFSSFDQNRLILALERKINVHHRLTVAAMYQSTPVVTDRYVIQLIWNTEL